MESAIDNLVVLIAEASGQDQGAVRALLDAEQGEERALFAEIVRRGILTEAECYRSWARVLGLPFHVLSDRTLSPDLLHRLPLDVARAQGAVVVREDEQVAEVVLRDPLSAEALAIVQEVLQKLVQPVVSMPSAIERALERQERGQSGIEGLIARIHSADVDVAELGSAEKLKRIAGEDAVVKLVDYIVEEALRLAASDIHLEPLRSTFRVRVRVDGDLETLHQFPLPLHGPVVSRVKVLSGMDISERRKPQDGRYVVDSGEAPAELRVSTLPTMFGEKLVMRILDKETLRLELDAIGFTPRHLELFRRSIHSPNGLVLLTGPTGSGKTTTLYAALREVNQENLNVVTVEDPVEYYLPGAAQVQVDLKAGRSFAGTLRWIPRQDPDIVMVGEIRDPETASIAVQAALTGHLVLSTLHTNDAPGAVYRLLDMGIEPYLLAPALRCVVAQRLLTRVCARCAVPHRPDAGVLEALGFEGFDGPAEEAGFRRGTGCSDCRRRGYRGRVPIHEILTFDHTLRRIIAKGAEEDAFKAAARASAYTPLVRDGLTKAQAGLVTAEELFTVVQID